MPESRCPEGAEAGELLFEDAARGQRWWLSLSAILKIWVSAASTMACTVAVEVEPEW